MAGIVGIHRPHARVRHARRTPAGNPDPPPPPRHATLASPAPGSITRRRSTGWSGPGPPSSWSTRAVILFASSLAEICFARGSLRAVNGRLAAGSHKVALRLAHLIHTATNRSALGLATPRGGAVAIERADGRPPVTVLVTPFRSSQAKPMRRSSARRSTRAGVRRDPKRRRSPGTSARTLFRPYPAQAAVAARVAAGQTWDCRRAPHQPAYRREHLNVVFAKMEPRHRQLVAPAGANCRRAARHWRKRRLGGSRPQARLGGYHGGFTMRQGTHCSDYRLIVVQWCCAVQEVLIVPDAENLAQMMRWRASLPQSAVSTASGRHGGEAGHRRRRSY